MAGRPQKSQWPDYDDGLCKYPKEGGCKAPKAKDTPYCIGHLRGMIKRGEYVHV